MSAPELLLTCAARWRGTSALQDPETGAPDAAPSTAIVTPVLAGRFVRLDYTWAYRGKSQEGSMLIGHVAESGLVTVHWIDTWHMSDKVMACQGRTNERGVIDVHGSYAAPPGPDWGWRIVITPGQKTLGIVMYNITPAGQEALAVEASYVRA